MNSDEIHICIPLNKIMFFYFFIYRSTRYSRSDCEDDSRFSFSNSSSPQLQSSNGGDNDAEDVNIKQIPSLNLDVHVYFLFVLHKLGE